MNENELIITVDALRDKAYRNLQKFGYNAEARSEYQGEYGAYNEVLRLLGRETIELWEYK